MGVQSEEKEVELGGGDEVHVELTCALGATLEGTVFRGEAPAAPGVGVWVEHAKRDPRLTKVLAQVETGTSGEYRLRIPAGAAGELLVYALDKGSSAMSAVTSVVVDDTTYRRMDLRLRSTHRTVVKVVNETGAPVVDLPIVARCAEEEVPSFTGVTDGRGECNFECLIEGLPYELAARSAIGQKHLRIGKCVGGRDESIVVSARLVESGTVIVELTSLPAGAQWIRYELTLWDGEEARPQKPEVSELKGGAVALRALPTDIDVAIELSVGGSQVWRTGRLRVRPNEERRIQGVLAERTAARVQVTSAEGVINPRGMFVGVQPLGATASARRSGAVRMMRAALDVNGEAVVAVPPGTYEVWLYGGASPRRLGTVEVGPHGTTLAPFTVP